MSETTNLQKEEAKTPAKKQISHSQRFTDAVLKEYKNNAGEVELTKFQKKLINNYFIKLDANLKDAEVKRMKKSEGYRDAVSLTWENVNMNKLAFEVVAFSSVGLDPLQSNHINLIPYKNGSTGKYGLNAPDDIVIELVFSNDVFKMIKKDADNEVENYKLSSENPFDRGELIGGFYYHKYFKTPQRNKLRLFTKAEIEKRKPKYASAEFWGGEKKVYGSTSGETEKVDGYYLEMCWKTMFRAGHNDITIDSEKIETHIQQALSIEESNYFGEINESNTEDATHEDVTDEVNNETGTKKIEFEKTPTEPTY